MRRVVRTYKPVAIALTAYDIWRRLPPRQRKQILDIARTHGPRVAARAMKAGARVRKRPER